MNDITVTLIKKIILLNVSLDFDLTCIEFPKGNYDMYKSSV